VAENKMQSIDEVTAKLHGFLNRTQAEQLARQIKADITREVGPLLRSSIGIAPTWLLAKVASDMQKPDGLVILDDEDIPGKLLHLKPGDIAGIGPNIQRRLEEHGITTMAQLYAANAHEFRGIWGGVRGEQIWRLLHGEDLPYFEQQEARPSGTGPCCRRQNATRPTPSPPCTACCKRRRCGCAIPRAMPAPFTSTWIMPMRPTGPNRPG